MSSTNAIVIALIGLVILAIPFLLVAPSYCSPGEPLTDCVLKGAAFAIATIPFTLPFIIILANIVSEVSK